MTYDRIYEKYEAELAEYELRYPIEFDSNSSDPITEAQDTCEPEISK